MARHNCSVHGEYWGDYGCAECLGSQERSERANKDLLEKIGELSEETSKNARVSFEAAERLAYLTNNPGEYPCPACGFRTLIKYASCCPKCQTAIPDSHWKFQREWDEKQKQRKENERQTAERAAEAERERREVATNIARELQSIKQERKDMEDVWNKAQQDYRDRRDKSCLTFFIYIGLGLVLTLFLIQYFLGV